MSLPCGANLNLDAITSASTDFKDSLKSKLGGAGTFTSASDLKSLADSKMSSVTAQVQGLLPTLPTVPPLSFQTELTSLAGINLSTPQGLLDYQSKLSSITENFGSALSSGGFNLDDLVAQAAPALSTATGALSGALDPSASASSLINDAISEASSVASSLGSIASGGASFDVCKDCPNFELEAGATEAIQKAQNSVLAQAEGAIEKIADIETNVDFNAEISTLTTKANKILADPDVQAQISSDVASASTQIEKDISSGLDKIPADLSAVIPEGGISIPNISSKFPKKFPL